MATQRPLKEGSVRTYQEKVALGFPDILASEMDADLDTIYAAWNGNVGTANLVDGSVTYAKLAPDAQLWRDTGTLLLPGTNFATRPIAIVGGTGGATAILGSATVKGRVQQQVVGGVGVGVGLYSNRDWNNANAQDDATKPSWGLQLRTDQDQVVIHRSPAGSTTQTAMLTLDSAGLLTLGGAQVKLPNAGVLQTWLNAGNPAIDLIANFGTSATKPQWIFRMDSQSDFAYITRQAANSGANTTPLLVGANGDFTISGTNATKASGTSWINPSDRRLKEEIEDYATGLAAILQLQPRTFLYNGKGGSTAGMRGYGFIADEVAPVMPDTVGVRAGKLDAADEDETDIQTLDQSNLILALVNAVKELAARVAAVEPQ